MTTLGTSNYFETPTPLSPATTGSMTTNINSSTSTNTFTIVNDSTNTQSYNPIVIQSTQNNTVLITFTIALIIYVIIIWLLVSLFYVDPNKHKSITISAIVFSIVGLLGLIIGTVLSMTL